jgi:hypothetical protein
MSLVVANHSAVSAPQNVSVATANSSFSQDASSIMDSISLTTSNKTKTSRPKKDVSLLDTKDNMGSLIVVEADSEVRQNSTQNSTSSFVSKPGKKSSQSVVQTSAKSLDEILPVLMEQPR